MRHKLKLIHGYIVMKFLLHHFIFLHRTNNKPMVSKKVDSKEQGSKGSRDQGQGVKR